MAVAFRFDEQYDIRASFAPLVCDSSEEWQFLLLDPLATHRLAVAIRRRGGLDIEIVKHVLSPEDLARGGQEMPPERPRCDGDVKRTG
jgi:hypothetical protein